MAALPMNEQELTTPTGVEEPPTETTSLVSRMANVLAAPTEVFDEVRSSPPRASNWLVPALVWMLVGWLGAWLIGSQDAVRQQISDLQEKQFEKMIASGKLTREQLEARRPMMEKVTNISRQVGQVAGPPVAAFASPFFWGLICWLLGVKVFKGQFRYMKGVEVSGLSSTISIVESLVTSLLIVVFGNILAAPGAVLLVLKDADPASLKFGLLAMANALAIWGLAVRSIGLARLSGVSTAKTACWLFGLWLVWRLGIVGVTQLTQRLGGGG